MTYPISEIFESVQGEGTYSGTPMTFIRFAGCNVGRPYLPADQPMGMPSYRERCTTWAGESFPCDTNYRKEWDSTVEGLMIHGAVQRAQRVCLTGGEPLLHNLVPLIGALHMAGKYIHIETSGTRPLPGGPRVGFRDWVWVTCSPKKDYLLEVLTAANEIKVLVGAGFNEEKFVAEFRAFLDGGRLFIQPIDDGNSGRHLETCLQIQDKYRGVRLSLQLHKIMNMR